MTTDAQMELAVYQWLNPYTTGPDGGPHPAYLTSEDWSARLLEELGTRWPMLSLWRYGDGTWQLNAQQGDGYLGVTGYAPDRKRAILLAAYEASIQ